MPALLWTVCACLNSVSATLQFTAGHHALAALYAGIVVLNVAVSHLARGRVDALHHGAA